jgi:murein L,D-transpeptidase YcbB/YkuD
MKRSIKIICLSFIVNSAQIFASDYSFDVDQEQSDPQDQFSNAVQTQPDPPSRLFNTEQIQADLQTRLSHAENALPSDPRMQHALQFYQSRQYKPVWIDENGLSQAGRHALAALENAGAEGLDPNTYKSALSAARDSERYPERATEAELTLTKAVLQYIGDVNGNRVSPEKITQELSIKRLAMTAPNILADKMKVHPSGAWLESYTFNNPHYQALKKLLAEHRRMLREAPYKDREIAKKIQQIVINMERWRWLPEKMPERYALINIAAFELKCIENDRVALKMPVVIGTHYRKTPVFESTVESIRFNPSWHLPRHIAIEDSLPKIKADPGYINQRKYVLYNSAGQAISPFSVNWASVTPSNFNFHLRQVPGSHNVMGKIRFGLTNSNGICLHDTSDKEHFDEPVRTYSSGCVRLKHPDEFAAFLFNDSQEWPLSKIRENMEGTLTKHVPLAQPLPVYITYFTVWEDGAGKMRFTDDVYGKDQPLTEALNAYLVSTQKLP